MASPSRFAFTLIELLVVIAIISVLSVVVILSLNPAELLRQARDATRISDLGTMNTALGLYATDVGGSMGSSSVIYLSLPDPAATSTLGTDCFSLGFPKGVFHCSASITFTKTDGTGWIPVDLQNLASGSPLGILPTDPENAYPSSTSYYSYTTDGNRWKLSAFPESQKYLAQSQSFMNGSSPSFFGSWLPVPGNPQFNTSNFWVMQYEAKNVGGIPVSQAALTPWVSISQTNSITACTSLGAHLITNNEWQTIAWNVQAITSNWKNGIIGSTEAAGGGLFRGNSNSSTAMDGFDPLSGTNTRTLILSNGAVIWDLAGNVWDWVNATTTGANEPNDGATGALHYIQFNNVTNWGAWTQATIGPINPIWNSSQGIGMLLAEASSTDATPYGFLRGGTWNDGAQAGVGALALNTGPGSTNTHFGFRCAR